MTGLICLGEPLYELNAAPDGSFWPGLGGDVSNVAVAAARQGASSGIITCIGDDPFGHALLESWEAEKVDATHVRIIPEADTGLYFVTHDAEGHHFTYRRRGSAASTLSEQDLPVEAIRNAAVLYASGISLAVSTSMRGAVCAAVATARAAGGLIAFDPNLRTRLWPLAEAREITHAVMRHCDIALPGLDDARQLTGRDAPEDIAEFYHELGATTVALTLGANGVLISTEGRLTHIPPYKVHAIDATGAGDCFNGIFLARLLAGDDPVAAAECANIGAAISTTRQGAVAAIPNQSEILAARSVAS